MSDAVSTPITGEGYSVGSIGGLGEGYGFRKVRRELGVEAFGVNALVFPPGYVVGPHFHDEQEELVFICVGGKDGYVGRDGRVPEGANPRPDLNGPLGAAPTQ